MTHGKLRQLTRSGILLLLVLIPLLVSLHLLSGAVQNTNELSRLFIPLLLLNLMGLVLLLTLIIVNLVRLIGQYRRKEPGSRLTLRMVMVFLMLSIPPVGVVYYYSLDFLHKGIDSWFDVKIDGALDDSLRLGRASLELSKKHFLRTTEQLLNAINDDSETAMAISMVDLLSQSGAVELVLTDTSGRVVGSAHANPDKIVPENLETSMLQQARDGGRVVELMPYGEREQLHVVVVLRHAIRPLILRAAFAVGEEITDLTESVQSAVSRYKELAFLRQSLKFNFSLTLLLVLAFSVFAAVWAAFFMARRLVSPISDIAAGTRAVAAGDYEKQLPLPDTNDELSFLVTSFNTMMRRIAYASDQAARSQRMVEEQKTYLETVLGHLSSGVMVFDPQINLQTSNPAASAIFGFQCDQLLHRPLHEIADCSEHFAQWAEKVKPALESRNKDWREEISLYGSAGRLVLLTRISPLKDSAGHIRGSVVVFDDITQLLQAQRNAAWGEVARRLAHEIKNPLTPIQLSAERLRHKYLGKMSEQDARVLDKATHTIVQQVDAMKSMVNAFSDYAKPSRLEKQLLVFDDLVSEVMSLYETSGRADFIKMQLDTASASINADPVRLRQVIHNLVKNALEAVSETTDPRIWVKTHTQTREEGVSIVFEVLDNGPGFDEGFLENVFEPYVTNKTKGTGLGLAVVKKIIEEHGGIILASNRQGGGASLMVRLPVIATQAEQNGEHA